MKNEKLHLELGRRYHFSASHRLHSPKLSDEENCRIYGKCNNPYGHGHNYTVEIRLSGPIDRATGMISNLTDLDKFVNDKVIKPFDHRSLNEEIPEFKKTVPTTEVLCMEIFKRLKTFPHAKLEAVRVVETSNNSFEYGGN